MAFFRRPKPTASLAYTFGKRSNNGVYYACAYMVHIGFEQNSAP